MKYAVNICDLLKYSKLDALPEGPLLLLQPILERDSDKVLNCEGERWDGAATPVKESCPAERWEAIYHIIRNGTGNQPGIAKHELRIYESKTGKGGWKRV